MPFNYESISGIRSFLEENGIMLKKKWGQNFLINRGAREKIVSCLAPQPGELIWEIGPGMGAVTALILKQQARLVAFEIDRGLIGFLQDEFRCAADFTIIQGDVVKTWQQAFDQYGMPVRILGNLPYASASAIIAAFISGGLTPRKMVFTVQKELALRMTASPGSKNYSSFSIFCQFPWQVSLCCDLKPGSFFPVPDVTSTVIEMVPATGRQFPADRELFLELVRRAFHARRKTLFNNLTGDPPGRSFTAPRVRQALQTLQIRTDARGEQLTIEDFIRLADQLILLNQQDD